MTKPWSAPTTAFHGTFGPGGKLRCWCGHRIEDLGPYAYGRVMVQQTTTGAPDDIHRTIQCPKCGSLLHTIYTMRPDVRQ